jgi:hypothetical protein
VDCELAEDDECPAKSSVAPLAKVVTHFGHQSRVPRATSFGMSCTTLAQAEVEGPIAVCYTTIVRSVHV